MLDYAVKLTRTPWAMTADDVEALRRAGFDDAAILDVNQVASYYAFVNRLADGLGVELESFWDRDETSRRG
jgi:alkylhydroperoxidase family enzyme